MRKSFVAVGALLMLFCVPFTVFAISFDDSLPLNSEYRAGPALTTLSAAVATIGFVILIIGIAPSQKKAALYVASEYRKSEPQHADEENLADDEPYNRI